MSTSPLFALVVGVSDCPALGAAGAAPGCGNDAVAMTALLGRLGATPATTTTLISPSRDGAGAPTRAAILSALTQLIASLRADPTALGVVFYAGHGATDGEHLLLCPSDTTPNLGNTLSFADVLGLIGDQPLPRLTFALDCCFSGAAGTESDAPRASARTLTPSADPAGATHWHDRLTKQVVVLSASSPTGPSYAYSLRTNVDRPDAVHGAFTFGLCALLQRWSPPAAAPDQPDLYPLSYGQLVQRLTQLCGALAFPQTPQVVGPAGVEGWLVFRNRPGGIAAPALPGREISGGTYDTFFGDVHADAEPNVFVGFYAIKDAPGETPKVFWKSDYTASGTAYSVSAPTAQIGKHDYKAGDTWPTTAPGTGNLAKPQLFDVLSATGSCIGAVVVVGDRLCWLLADATVPDTFQLAPGHPANLLALTPAHHLIFQVTSLEPHETTDFLPQWKIRQGSPTGELLGGLDKNVGNLTWYKKTSGLFTCTATDPLWFTPPGQTEIDKTSYRAVDSVVT